LTREHSKEIGQPPIQFTVFEKIKQPKKDKNCEFTYIYETNPLAQISNILMGIEDPNDSQIDFQLGFGSGKPPSPP